MVKIYVDERGVVLEFWTNIDLSIYPILELVIRKPSGRVVVANAYVTDRSNNVAVHIVTDDELDEKGVYKFQLVAKDGNGNALYYSRIVTVYVDNPVGGG